VDTQLRQAQEGDCASIGGQHRGDSTPRPRKAGRKRKKPKGRKDHGARNLAVLVRHCFPGFWNSIDRIEDPRDPARIDYDIKHVLCLTTLMFACRIPSRKQLDRISDDATFLDNLCRFAGVSNETVITSQQMVNVL